MINREIMKKQCIDHILEGSMEIHNYIKNLAEMTGEEESHAVTTKCQYVAEKVYSKIHNEIHRLFEDEMYL